MSFLSEGLSESDRRVLANIREAESREAEAFDDDEATPVDDLPPARPGLDEVSGRVGQAR